MNEIQRDIYAFLLESKFSSFGRDMKSRVKFINDKCARTVTNKECLLDWVDFIIDYRKVKKG